MDEREQSANEQEPLSEQAAVQMPAGSPAESSDGVVGAPTSPPLTNQHPALFERTAPFWQQPPAPRTYLEPPFILIYMRPRRNRRCWNTSSIYTKQAMK